MCGRDALERSASAERAGLEQLVDDGTVLVHVRQRALLVEHEHEHYTHKHVSTVQLALTSNVCDVTSHFCG